VVTQYAVGTTLGTTIHTIRRTTPAEEFHSPKASDGVFSFVYSGDTGVGMGVVVVEAGRIFGRDFFTTYDGTVEEQSDGKLKVSLTMTIPRGVTLVQGTSPQDVPHQRAVEHTFPPNFGDGEPQQIETGPGKVWVMIKRTPEDMTGFREAAIHGFTLEIARKLG
jgi:hypothetical protein